MQNYDLKNTAFLLLVTVTVYIYFANIKSINIFVTESLNLCYTTVIPSLFIFMVLTSFLSELKNTEILGMPFAPLFRLLNIHNRRVVSYCILSLISGFAVGGYFNDKLEREYCCSKNMLGVVSIITSNNSPAFVISAVGLNMRNNLTVGVMLYFSIIISSFITAFIFSFIFPYSPIQARKTDYIKNSDTASAITISVNAILRICATVIFSLTICKVVQLYTSNPSVSCILAVLFEVTSACKIITESFGNNIYLLCIALTFCPLSTCMQFKYSKNSIFSFKILFLSKLIHIPLSLIILRIFINLFPQACCVYASSDVSVHLYWNQPHISFFMLILSLCFVVCFDKKIGVFTILHK